MESTLPNSTDKQDLEQNFDPKLMSKYTPCEWKYSWLDKESATCGKPLTNKEIALAK